MTRELTTPTLAVGERVLQAALFGLATHTCRVYTRHLEAFFEARSTLTRESVERYLSQKMIGTSSYNQALSAIKRLSKQAASHGWLDYQTALQIDNIPSRKVRGVRVGHWLDKEQAGRLLALAQNGTIQSKRDHCLLALLLGCGLRRDEAALLQVDQVEMRGSLWYLVNVLGKGNRVRTIQIQPWVKQSIDAWVEAAQLTSGPILRSFRPNGTINQRLSPSGIFMIVLDYAQQLDCAISPHDLRRTFAKLCRKGGCPMDVIRDTLGHSSITTTERYVSTGEGTNAGDYLGL